MWVALGNNVSHHFILSIYWLFNLLICFLLFGQQEQVVNATLTYFNIMCWLWLGAKHVILSFGNDMNFYWSQWLNI